MSLWAGIAALGALAVADVATTTRREDRLRRLGHDPSKAKQCANGAWSLSGKCDRGDEFNQAVIDSCKEAGVNEQVCEEYADDAVGIVQSGAKAIAKGVAWVGGLF